MATEKIVGQSSLDLVVKAVYEGLGLKANKAETYTKDDVNRMIGKSLKSLYKWFLNYLNLEKKTSFI